MEKKQTLRMGDSGYNWTGSLDTWALEDKA